MSSEFALLLNMPTTRLVVRGDGVWQVAGEADLSSEDPGKALGALRETGETIAGGKFSCLLILPNDQIKYLSVPATANDEETARAALDGATPYKVEDLAFDWVRVGERLYVAAVAYETLDEALDFVGHHGFTSAGIVAAPRASEFPKRPVFDSPKLDRGEDVLPVGGAYVAAPPSPPPAFTSRRETPPVVTAPTTGKGSDVTPRLTLSATRPEPAQPAPVAAHNAPKPKPSPSPKPAPKPASVAPGATDVLAGNAAPIGGKPRYLGLVLTLALLVILAAVALWSMTLGEDEAQLDPDTAPEVAERAPVVATEQMRAQEPAPSAVREQGDTAIADAQPPALLVPSEQDTQAALDPQVDTAALPDIDAPTEELLPDLPAPVLPPRPLTDEEVASLYEETGVWQRAPRATSMPQEITVDGVYVASIDPETLSADAVALPDLDSLTADTPADTLADPASPDQTFALDDTGRVIPTEDGALSPDGILVFAGRPPVTVTPRPEAAPVAAEEPDQRLAALRPAPRPDGLQEANERAQLGGRTLEEFASIRPELRPKAPQELAAEIAAATAAAAAAVENPPESVAPPDPFATGTRLASATSRKPQTRPRNFAQIIETARTRAAQPSNEGRVVASVAPRAVRPSGPVPTTVSRAATMQNAINLRRVNLIGVFGKPASRTALVRLRNGRIVRVSVGDRIDGGRVAAIGESELRYVKSGRNLTLKIPSG